MYCIGLTTPLGVNCFILVFPDLHMRRSVIRIYLVLAFAQSNRFEYSISKVLLYKNGEKSSKNL